MFISAVPGQIFMPFSAFDEQIILPKSGSFLFLISKSVLPPAMLHFVKRSESETLKQAAHWHDKEFTPWHAIWRASEGRTRDSVRGDAWRCGSGEVVSAISWRKF